MQLPQGRNVEVEGLMRPVLESWVWALGYGIFTFGLLWVAIFVARSGAFILIAGLFAAYGFSYLYTATRATLDSRHFGAMRLRVAGAPAAIGGRLQGSLRISESAAVEGSVRAELRCILVWFEEGRREQVVWSEERSFPIRAQPVGSYAIVEFDIPADMPPSSAPPVVRGGVRGRNYARWEIQAIAESGGAYRDELYTVQVAPGKGARLQVKPGGALPMELEPPESAEEEAATVAQPENVRAAPIEILRGTRAASEAVSPVFPRMAKPVELAEHLAEPENPPPAKPDPGSIALLVAANLVAFAGVAFWGWQVGQVVFLYWAENLIVGGFNVLRILAAGGPAQDYRSGAMGSAGKLWHAVFFGVHYGGFCFVHGIFLAAFFGSGPRGREGLDAMVLRMLHEPVVVVALLALLASHGWSFFRNYIGRGEYERAQPRKLMGQPYGRIIVVHIFILAGGFLMLRFSSPLGPMLLFVVLKTAVDLLFHYREHRRQSSP